MGSQTGVFYFDKGRILPEEAGALIGNLFPSDAAEAAFYRDSGVLLIQGGDVSGAMTFDGRLDNRGDLAARFGVRLGDNTSDGEIVRAVYDHCGAAGFVHLIGDWSLALWNAAERCVVLASDYAGIRPLYYAVQPHGAVWSTRLGPLVDLLKADEIDDRFVASFLRYGDCPHRTPYASILPVLAGHSVTINRHGVKVQRFWEPPAGRVIRYKDESAYEEQLRSLFAEAVRCRLSTNEPVLAELSGGFDSSSVVSMASRLIARHDVEAPEVVTLTSEHAGSLDARFYRAVEKHCEIARAIHVSTDALRFLTESDTGGASPAFWDNKDKQLGEIAGNLGAKTYLTGLLGDLVMGNWFDDSEQVAGFLRRNPKRALYEAFLWSKHLRIPIYGILWNAFWKSLPAAFVPTGAPLRQASPGDAAQGDSLTPAFRKRVDSPDEGFSQFWKQAQPERRKHVRCLTETLELRKLRPPEPLENLAFTHPYSHRPLVEFMLTIPAEVVTRPGEPRFLMRKALHFLWPPELQGRRSKDSFGGMFIDTIRPFAQTLLEQPLEVVERGYVDRRQVDERLNKLLRGLEANALQLQQIILLELWLRGRRARSTEA